MPDKYRYNAEVRAQPTFFGPDIVGQRFIKTLDEVDDEAADDKAAGDLEEGGQ
ncbi:MAG: hypothetical protein R3F43_08660 [bacterium]